MIKKPDFYYKNERSEMLSFLPVSAAKILDVGCGAGNFASQLVGDGKEIWGIEPVESSALIASEKLHKVLIGKIEDVLASLPDNYFDAIFFNDVLEHLIDPWVIVSKMKSKLTDNGHIICSIPNVRHIRNLGHLLIDRDWQYLDNGIRDNTHLRFFTKKSISRFITENGFKLIRIKGINRTKSERLHIYFFLINLLTFFQNRDLLYLQYVAVGAKNS